MSPAMARPAPGLMRSSKARRPIRVAYTKRGGEGRRGQAGRPHGQEDKQGGVMLLLFIMANKQHGREGGAASSSSCSSSQ